MRRTADAMRYAYTCDLEHICRCYRNAYIARLEGQCVKASAVEKEWRKLCDIMFGILVQEGIVAPDKEEDE